MAAKNSKSSPRRSKKTVGAASIAHALKQFGPINPIELGREILKGKADSASYEESVWKCVDRGKKEIQGDFFIVVLLKKERLMNNVIRQYFFYRYSCPTPQYDQVVYKYHAKEDEIEFLWVVPDKEHVIKLSLNREKVPESEQGLIQMIDEFITGQLDRKCAFLNGEQWNG